jgi:hypothetical protein
MSGQTVVAFINTKKLILSKQIFKPSLLKTEVQMSTIPKFGNREGQTNGTTL